MMGMAGIRLHPAVRLGLGAAIAVVGLVTHVTGLIVGGALLAGFGLISMVGRLSTQR